jgi:high-affinity Fe2+/Pb2+ permease
MGIITIKNVYRCYMATKLSNFKHKTSPAVFLIATYLLLAFVLTPLAVVSGIQAFEIIVTLINILACVVFFYKIFECQNVMINLSPLKKVGL